LGAKQGRTEWEACDWSPESSKRARISCPAAQRDFMDRTTQLFEELKAEVHARVERWKRDEAVNRDESRRIAEQYPIVFAEDLVTPSMDPREPASQPEAMQGTTSPSSPSEGAFEPRAKKSDSRSLSARETPAMGPAKHASPTIDTSAFSRSLSFKPEPVTELTIVSKDNTMDLPDLSLTPAAMSSK